MNDTLQLAKKQLEERLGRSMSEEELNVLKGKYYFGNNYTPALRNSKTLFESAVTWELIPKNPFKKVKAPKCVTRPWHYLKPFEYRKLLEVAPSLRWKAFYSLVYTAGLRFGEAVSLRWTDLDFTKGEVRIQNRPGTSKIPPFLVKDYEARRVPLPKHTLDILEDLKAYNDATDQTPFVMLDDQHYKTVLAKWREYQKQGRAWRNQDMANNTLREFNRHLRHAEIKPNGTLSVHTLRKSCIQNWANELPINVTKELAGHSSIATTQKYYLQVDEYHRAKAAAVIDALVADDESESEMTDARLTPRGNFGHSKRKART